MIKFRRIFNPHKLPDTAELLSVTPYEEKPRYFFDGSHFDVSGGGFTAFVFMGFIAALPPHMPESLRLSGPPSFEENGEAQPRR